MPANLPKGLRIFAAGCLLAPWLLCAQPGAGERYRLLVESMLAETGRPVRELSGEPVLAWLPPLPSGSTAEGVLVLNAPQVRYEPLPDGRYARMISVAGRYERGFSQELSAQAADTLTRAQLLALHRQAPPPLRGDLPTASRQWIQPLAIVCGSFALLLSLYYLRTPR
jgi:hypothetical protein